MNQSAAQSQHSYEEKSGHEVKSGSGLKSGQEIKAADSGFVFKSLVAKLLAFLIFLQVLVPAFVFIGIEFSAHQTQRAQLITDGHELIDLQSTALENALWEYNNDAIIDLLSIIAARPYVQKAELKGLNGDLIAAIGDSVTPKYPEYLISRDLSYAFSTGEEPVGMLSVTLNDQIIITRLYERLSINGLITLATQAFLILITIIGVRRIVSRPFAGLLESLDQGDTPLSGGLLSRRIAYWAYPGDALGQFVQAYNVLRKEQDENTHKLADYSEQLKEAGERLADTRQHNEQVLFSMDEKIAELERFTQLSAGREQQNRVLKKHVNELLGELERPPAYSVVQFEDRLEEDIALIETMNPVHKLTRFLNEATPQVLFQLERHKLLETFLVDVWRLAFVFVDQAGQSHFLHRPESLTDYRFGKDLEDKAVAQRKSCPAEEGHPAYEIIFRQDSYVDISVDLSSLAGDFQLQSAPGSWPVLHIGGLLLSSQQEVPDINWVPEKQAWQFTEARLKQLISHVYRLLGFSVQRTVSQTYALYMQDFMKAQYLAALSVAEESEAICQEVTKNKSNLDNLLSTQKRDLDEASDLLQQTLSTISDGVFILDAELCYTLYNQKYVEIFDVPRNLIGVGRPFADVIRFLGLEDIPGIEEMEKWVEAHLSALSQEEEAPEVAEMNRLLRKDDSQIEDSPPIEESQMESAQNAQNSSTTQGGVMSFTLHIDTNRIIEVTQSGTREGGIIGIAIDVTEQMRAQRALEEAEQHSRLILNSAADGIIGLDIAGKITFVNESACKFLGYEQDGLIGAPMHESIQHSDATGSKIPVDMSRVFLTLYDGRTQNSDNEVLWRKDNSSFPVEYSCKPIYKGDVIIGAVFTFQDITERLETQRIVQEKIEELEDFSLMAVGRELEMIDLKKEINRLRQETGQQELYEIPE